MEVMQSTLGFEMSPYNSELLCAKTEWKPKRSSYCDSGRLKFEGMERTTNVGADKLKYKFFCCTTVHFYCTVQIKL
jgi:hypothetical protein